MTGTYIQPGNNINYTNNGESTIAAGTLVVVGLIAAVAATTIQPGEMGALATTGVFAFEKDNTDIEAGAAVYYNSETDTATADDTDGIKIGVAVAAAGTTAAAVNVRLNN
ncbi:MAG: capsid cement protein [Candidatus Ornithomonoglobus sp.]